MLKMRMGLNTKSISHAFTHTHGHNNQPDEFGSDQAHSRYNSLHIG